MVIIGSIVFWLICAGFSAFIASQKNRAVDGWFILGFLFGPVALFAIGVIPALPKRTEPTEVPREDKFIPLESLEADDVDPLSYSWKIGIVSAIVIGVALSVIFLYNRAVP